MSCTTGTGSRNEADVPGARLRGARADRHLAQVTALAVATLIAAQWLAVHLPPPRTAEPERPSRTAVEVTEVTSHALRMTAPERLAGVREQEKSA
jgi:hypothetical protein